MRRSGTLGTQTKKEEDLSVLRRYVICKTDLKIEFNVISMLFFIVAFHFLYLSLCSVFTFPSPDARVLEHRRLDSKDALLGSGDGWLASPAGHPPAKMVPLGLRTGSDERV